MPVQVQYSGQPTIDRPVGIKQAVWSKIIDLGLRPDIFHPGKFKNQLIVVWQLAEMYDWEGKKVPMQQTAFVNNSINSEKSTLHKFMVGTLGSEIFSKPWPAAMTLDDMLIGKNCMLSLSKKIEKKDGVEKTYSQIDAVAPLMAGLPEIKVDPTVQLPSWIGDYVKGFTQGKIDASAAPVDLSSVLKAV